MNLILRPLPLSEHRYSYSLDPSSASITGCIGHHQETIGLVLYEPTWTSCQEDLCTSDFQSDLAAVLDFLRSGILSSAESARACCRAHPECATNYLRYAHVFRIDTEKYAYILRLNRHRVEKDAITYGVVIYCYDKSLLNGCLKQAEGNEPSRTPQT